MRLYILLVFMLFSLCGYSQQQFAPVNPNTSAEARQLLSYIYSIKGKQIISGQHSYPYQPNRHIDSVKAITGKEPALWGNDFIWSGTRIKARTL
jgi:mannan endo-1,4-beta-mannosidase